VQSWQPKPLRQLKQHWIPKRQTLSVFKHTPATCWVPLKKTSLMEVPTTIDIVSSHANQDLTPSLAKLVSAPRTQTIQERAIALQQQLFGCIAKTVDTPRPQTVHERDFALQTQLFGCSSLQP